MLERESRKDSVGHRRQGTERAGEAGRVIERSWGRVSSGLSEKSLPGFKVPEAMR